MSSYFIPIAILFQTLSLCAFLYQGTPGAVVLFGLASLGELFLVWIERGKLAESAAIRLELQELRNALGTLQMKAQQW